MSAILRRTAIYDEIERHRRAQDAFTDAGNLQGCADPDRDELERIAHLKALVGQLEGSGMVDKLLVALGAQTVAWLEALGEVEECRIESGEAA